MTKFKKRYFKASWKPSSSIKVLLKRSKIISKIREFFLKKNVPEIETPILSEFSVTDINLNSFKTKLYTLMNDYKKTMYLITSPEFHMKRLLAFGIGEIYQITKSFRNQEFGNFHNPEFTILEWYKPDCNMFQFINEVKSFLKKIFLFEKFKKISYQEIFKKFLDIDPLNLESFNRKNLFNLSKNFGLSKLEIREDIDVILQFLLDKIISLKENKNKSFIVYNFPSSQCSLAEINKEDPRVSERFEIYSKGIEIANGFYELTDFKEQKRRFILENIARKNVGISKKKIDWRFLSALKNGLPKSSGIAFGLDRIIMLLLNISNIRDVISFSIDCS